MGDLQRSIKFAVEPGELKLRPIDSSESGKSAQEEKTKGVCDQQQGYAEGILFPMHYAGRRLEKALPTKFVRSVPMRVEPWDLIRASSRPLFCELSSG